MAGLHYYENASGILSPYNSYLLCSQIEVRMNEAVFALIGVVVGIIGAGLVNLCLQKRQFAHEKQMHILRNQSAENVKALLSEMLSHKGFTDRNFESIRKRVGGYSDDEVRLLLHEVGAKKTSRKDSEEEWWYLKSREQERIENRKS